MKIAYFINQYPKVSHSFIRREISSLEAKNITVCRFSLRSNINELVDTQDIEEYTKTRYVLKVSPLRLMLIMLMTCMLNFKRLVSATILTIRIGKRSDRGLLRHFAYLIEACVLNEWMKSESVEHVHAHFGTNSTAVVMLAHTLGGPSYSFTVHGSEFNKPEFIALGEKIRQSAFVVAVSSYGRSQLYRWVEHDYWHKVKVVHCGLEPGFYQVDIPPVKGSSKLVCVGRLSDEKGQILLLKAASMLLTEGFDFQLVLAGDGPIRHEIEQLIKEYNLDSRVRVTGWINSDIVRDELLTARALVLPSFSEGLPVVIMEAMSLKRPVIATYLAGIPELVLPNDNGLLIPAGSIVQLKDAIIKILNMPDDEINKLGENARARVLEYHNIDTETDKLAAYFQESISCK